MAIGLHARYPILLIPFMVLFLAICRGDSVSLAQDSKAQKTQKSLASSHSAVTPLELVLQLAKKAKNNRQVLLRIMATLIVSKESEHADRIIGLVPDSRGYPDEIIFQVARELTKIGKVDEALKLAISCEQEGRQNRIVREVAEILESYVTEKESRQAGVSAIKVGATLKFLAQLNPKNSNPDSQFAMEKLVNFLCDKTSILSSLGQKEESMKLARKTFRIWQERTTREKHIGLLGMFPERTPVKLERIVGLIASETESALLFANGLETVAQQSVIVNAVAVNLFKRDKVKQANEILHRFLAKAYDDKNYISDRNGETEKAIALIECVASYIEFDNRGKALKIARDVLLINNLQFEQTAEYFDADYRLRTSMIRKSGLKIDDFICSSVGEGKAILILLNSLDLAETALIAGKRKLAIKIAKDSIRELRQGHKYILKPSSDLLIKFFATAGEKESARQVAQDLITDPKERQKILETAEYFYSDFDLRKLRKSKSMLAYYSRYSFDNNFREFKKEYEDLLGSDSPPNVKAKLPEYFNYLLVIGNKQEALKLLGHSNRNAKETKNAGERANFYTVNARHYFELGERGLGLEALSNAVKAIIEIEEITIERSEGFGLQPINRLESIAECVMLLSATSQKKEESDKKDSEKVKADTYQRMIRSQLAGFKNQYSGVPPTIKRYFKMDEIKLVESLTKLLSKK